MEFVILSPFQCCVLCKLQFTDIQILKRLERHKEFHMLVHTMFLWVDSSFLIAIPLTLTQSKPVLLRVILPLQSCRNFVEKSFF